MLTVAGAHWREGKALALKQRNKAMVLQDHVLISRLYGTHMRPWSTKPVIRVSFWGPCAAYDCFCALSLILSSQASIHYHCL